MRESIMNNSYLQHWGIKGMKWGIRRFRNSDGSLTSEGKERYGVNKTGESYGVADKGRRTSSVYGKYSGNGYIDSRYTATGSEIETVSRKMGDTANFLVDAYANAGGEVASAVKQVSSNKDVNQQAQSIMKAWFVSPSMIDDDEYAKECASDLAGELVTKYGPKTDAGERVQAIHQGMQAWFDVAKKETDRLASEKGDVIVGSDQFGEFTYKDVVYSTLVQSAPPYFPHMTRDGLWEAYLYNEGEANDALESFGEQIYNDFMKNG